MTERAPGDAVDRCVFGEAMRNVYPRALREAGCSATIFVRLLTDHGPLETARKLLASSTPSARHDVFTLAVSTDRRNKVGALLP